MPDETPQILDSLKIGNITRHMMVGAYGWSVEISIQAANTDCYERAKEFARTALENKPDNVQEFWHTPDA